MAFFIPLLLFAGAAGLSLLATHCGGTPKPPLPPPEPPPLPPGFPKDFLDYSLLLSRLEGKALAQPGALALTPLLQGKDADFRLPDIFQDSRQVEKAQEFIRHLAGRDGKAEDVSLYDIYSETQHHYGEEWKEEWRDRLLGSDFAAPLHQRLRVLGAPLVASPAAVSPSAPARDLLNSLAFYIGMLNPSQPATALSPALDFYLSGTEPPIFSKILKISYLDFMKLNDADQSESFRKALASGLPDLASAEKLVSYLSPDEAQRFVRECLRRDPKAALELFEKLRFPAWQVDTAKTSDESEFFPNLPQDTPYAKRQKAIDDFLPPPEQVLKRGPATLKKYRWLGDTEVFSLEGGKSGPTTLVFAPHFHENNPRKAFHWLKDLPLKSGRIILLPEANRAMAISNRDTRAMNNLFNKAFRGDRTDYLIVRRTEWLLGLCDGMIGLHDWMQRDPFFISDSIVDGQGNAGSQLSPVGSPWIPAEVKKIAKLSHAMTVDHADVSDDSPEAAAKIAAGGMQVQWQVAERAATHLEKLSGGRFDFSATPLAQRDSYRIDNATAYMNYFLKKPAMTFEANGSAEQGQLAAQAVYALLLAFGHGIDGNFERKLKGPNPSVEPGLYLGLPPLGRP